MWTASCVKTVERKIVTRRPVVAAGCRIPWGNASPVPSLAQGLQCRSPATRDREPPPPCGRVWYNVVSPISIAHFVRVHRYAAAMTSITTFTINPTIDRSAAIDRVVPDHKLRCRDERFDPGGGGINVAMAISELGADATAIYTCGGPMGDRLTRSLEKRSVAAVPLKIEGATRENVIIYETETENQFRFGFPGPKMSAEEQQRCIAAIKDLQPAPQYLVLSGSLPPGVPSDFYGRIIETLTDQTKVILDVGGEALRQGVDQSVFLLKPNQRELGELVGHEIESDTDARDAAKQMIDQGKVQAVMVSLGRGGVMLVARDAEVRINAPTVKIRSKIGAGDSTVAGTVLALSRGKSLAEAARFGVACGTAAVMTEGTELCRREDVERLYEEMDHEAVSR
jgi:6-phosphofructokinase 2